MRWELFLGPRFGAKARYAIDSVVMYFVSGVILGS